MAAVELLLNATHYAQYPAWKSVNRKNQSVIGDKSTFSCRRVFDFELAHGLRDSETSD